VQARIVGSGRFKHGKKWLTVSASEECLMRHNTSSVICQTYWEQNAGIVVLSSVQQLMNLKKLEMLNRK
jgi:hypothetical protein